MKAIILILASLLIVACDKEPGAQGSTQKIACIDGVKYVYFKSASGNQGYGYMSVKFNREGKVELCNSFAPVPPQ